MTDTGLAGRIAADLKQAMKDRDELRKAVLRSVKSDLDRQCKESGGELDHGRMLSVLRRQIKQRSEAAQIYQQASQQERAGRELAEAEILSGYLPAQLNSEEIAKRVDAVIAETGAASVADLGKVMGRLSRELSGKADMQQVAASVKARLS